MTNNDALQMALDSNSSPVTGRTRSPSPTITVSFRGRCNTCCRRRSVVIGRCTVGFRCESHVDFYITVEVEHFSPPQSRGWISLEYLHPSILTSIPPTFLSTIMFFHKTPVCGPYHQRPVSPINSSLWSLPSGSSLFHQALIFTVKHWPLPAAVNVFQPTSSHTSYRPSHLYRPLLFQFDNPITRQTVRDTQLHSK